MLCGILNIASKWNESACTYAYLIDNINNNKKKLVLNTAIYLYNLTNKLYGMAIGIFEEYLNTSSNKNFN